MTERYVNATHLLGDAAIRVTQEAIWKDLRLGVEPAAALPMAALITGRVVPRGDEHVSW